MTMFFIEDLIEALKFMLGCAEARLGKGQCGLLFTA